MLFILLGAAAILLPDGSLTRVAVALPFVAALFRNEKPVDDAGCCRSPTPFENVAEAVVVLVVEPLPFKNVADAVRVDLGFGGGSVVLLSALKPLNPAKTLGLFSSEPAVVTGAALKLKSPADFIVDDRVEKAFKQKKKNVGHLEYWCSFCLAKFKFGSIDSIRAKTKLQLVQKININGETFCFLFVATMLHYNFFKPNF